MMYNKFVSCLVSVVPRSYNSVADCLASHGANDLSAGFAGVRESCTRLY
jgi:hypothetical protein